MILQHLLAESQRATKECKKADKYVDVGVKDFAMEIKK